MPNRIEALRNRVALYRSVREDLAIAYMRQIADELDAINKPGAERHLPNPRGRGAASPAQAD